MKKIEKAHATKGQNRPIFFIKINKAKEENNIKNQLLFIERKLCTSQKLFNDAIAAL